MCGISGIWHRDGKPVPRSAIEAMNDVQAHRGPDGSGVWERPGLAFGHRRLSIMDPSPASDQPMGSSDGGHWVTFNGEIHNHQELRTELVSRGVQFSTSSDTEVLLHSYRTWGTECFARFNGM